MKAVHNRLLRDFNWTSVGEAKSLLPRQSTISEPFAEFLFRLRCKLRPRETSLPRPALHLHVRRSSTSSETDMWALSPDTRKVWDANGLPFDEPLPLWEGEAVDVSPSSRRRTILKADTEGALKDAERACSMLSRRGNLEQLNLKDNKPVPADDDRPYRMWYPTVVPRRILGKQIVVCEPNRQAVVDIKWSKILPHKGIIEEVKMREHRLRTDLSTSPAIRRRIMEYVRGNYRRCRNYSYMVDDLDVFARADIPDGDSDVLRQCAVSVYYPDVNYELESSRLLEVLLRKLGLQRHVRRKKLEVALPGSSKAIVIEDGGTCEFLNSNVSLSLVLDIPPHEDLDQYCAFFCQNHLSARPFNASERHVLLKSFNSGKTNVFENPFHVQFLSITDSIKALDKHGHKIAKILPRSFIAGSEDWTTMKNATMTFRVKWFNRPASGEGVLKFKNANDSQFAAEILFYHGYSDSERHSHISDDVRIVKGIPNAYQHDSIFEEHMREVLGVNCVVLLRAYLLRVPRSKIDISEAVRVQVGRALVKYLTRRYEWNGRNPLFRQQWRELLHSNDLPWHWNILDMKNNQENGNPCEAELIFKNVDQGLRLVDFLTSDIDDFTIYDDRGHSSQKITIKPVYCIPVLVTKEVRVACDSFIRKINEEEASVARMSSDVLSFLEILDMTWSHDHDHTEDVDTTIGELSVQGWPQRHVEEVAIHLLSMFQGTYIDCSDDIKGRLLYGYGAKYVEFARKKLRGRAVIDVDLLRERITLVGEAADLARKKLTFFAENSCAFELTDTILIGPPRYLYLMCDILRYSVTLRRLSEICGGPKLEFVKDIEIRFQGTLQQYDLLMDYLEEVDNKLVQSSSVTSSSSKPTCPVCLSSVSNAFYCLECGHYYCLKCIIYQVKTMIRNRDLPMRCIYMDCEKPISVDDIKHLVLGDGRLPWLSADKLRPLIDSSIDCLVRKQPDLIRCPTPDCFGICKNSEAKDVFRCDSCNKERCRGCMMEPHKKVSCEEYAVLRTDGAASLKAYMNKKKGKVRECPTKGCGAVIEKGEGCNHMQCTACNIHFCWLCDYTSETQAKVYGHLRETHGAIGEEWPVLEDEVSAVRRCLVEMLRIMPWPNCFKITLSLDM
ncbi:hypothetical protein RB195_019779 [Necator americanus]|uniref:IBR domain protein n=1 Tax=Necator americanus TaxID=51031 RepID=A0ABR1CI10_NECAM